MSDEMGWKAEWQPDAQLRELLTELIGEETKEGSAGAFARRYLPWTETVWSKMKLALDPERAGPSYFEQVALKKRAELVKVLGELPTEIALKRQQRAALPQFRRHELSHVKAAIQAIREAKEVKGPERVVIFVAPTGGGKTEVKNAVLTTFPEACSLEATRSWREPHCYTSVLRDVAGAVDLRGLRASTSLTIEQTFQRQRSGHPWPVLIDEAEFMGNDALFAVRFLCNKTALVPVLLTTPEGHEDWNDHFSAAYNHVARRCHARVEVSVIKADDVEMFFPEGTFDQPQGPLEAIAAAASSFGHFSLVNRVATRLHGQRRVPKSEVDKAIKLAQTAMVRGVAK